MTTTKETVLRKKSLAGGLTGGMPYKHDCKGVDDISLVGINYNTWGHVDPICNMNIIK